MSSSWNPNLSDDESDDEGDFSHGGRDAIVILMDANAKMFQDQDESGISCFRKCLKCIEAVMLNKIVCSEKDLISILLYNTQLSPDPYLDDREDVESIVLSTNSAILIALKPLTKEKIQYIKNLAESDDYLDFSNKYGHSTDSKISEVLWTCQALFTKCGYKLQTSTILHFTDIDIPHQPGSMEYQLAMVKAKDLQQLNLDYRLFPMQEDFSDVFYKDFLCTILQTDPDEFEMPAFQDQEEMLLRRIFKKDFKKRAQSHLKFFLNNDLSFGVDVFGFTRKTKIPRPLCLSRANFDKIVSKRSWKYATLDGEENADPVPAEPPELKEYLTPKLTMKYQQIGEERVRFTPLEVYRMKQVMDPGLKLLGFKPISAIDQELHLKTTYFLYPSDVRIKGSTKMFRALWEKCLEKEKAVICSCTLRKKSAPKLVALIPQREEADQDQEVMRFDGFRMVQIPYAGDVRNLKILEKEAVEVDDAAVAAFKEIIRKLSFKFGYKPSLFENPVIRTIYANVEAVCYQKEVEEIEDTVMPDTERQDRKIAKYVEPLTENFGDLSIETSGTKRKAPKEKEDGAGNRPKVQKGDLTPDQFLEAIRNDTIKSITVPQIKSCLTELGMTGLSKLNKDALIQKFKDYQGI